MGLDMYLYRQHEGQTADDIDRYLESFDADYSGTDWIEKWQAHKATVEVAYWRKANAIHAWFVETFQGGVDECQYSDPISREALAGLVQRCRDILDGKREGVEGLPTREGFFFGGTEYGEGYEYDLKETIRQLEPLIAERNSDTFIYRSSW